MLIGKLLLQQWHSVIHYLAAYRWATGKVPQKAAEPCPPCLNSVYFCVRWPGLYLSMRTWSYLCFCISILCYLPLPKTSSNTNVQRTVKIPGGRSCPTPSIKNASMPKETNPMVHCAPVFFLGGELARRLLPGSGDVRFHLLSLQLQHGGPEYGYGGVHKKGRKG